MLEGGPAGAGSGRLLGKRRVRAGNVTAGNRRHPRASCLQSKTQPKDGTKPADDIYLGEDTGVEEVDAEAPPPEIKVRRKAPPDLLRNHYHRARPPPH